MDEVQQDPKPREDMDELMVRLALIRSEIESKDPPSQRPTGLIVLVALLATLALLPLLFSGPCVPAEARADEARAELRKRVYHVEVQDGVLYSAAEFGLIITGVHDPAEPVRLGEVEIPGTALSVTVEDGVAYVCAGPGGLYLVDVRDPKKPMRLGHLDTPGSANHAVIQRGTAFLADGTMGTAIVDVRNPKEPVETGRLDTADYVRSLWLEGGRLVTAEDRAGIRLWKVRGRRRPVMESAVKIPGQARGLVVLGGRAYVAAGTAGLAVVDVRKGRRTQVLVTIPTDDTARGVALLGEGHLVLADGGAGLKVFDLSRPTGSRLDARFAAKDGSALRVATVGHLAFVAYDYRGVRLWDMTDPLEPSALDLSW